MSRPGVTRARRRVPIPNAEANGERALRLSTCSDRGHIIDPILRHLEMPRPTTGDASVRVVIYLIKLDDSAHGLRLVRDAGIRHGIERLSGAQFASSGG